MPNYELKYSPAEAARICNVDRDTVKKWAFIFKNYLDVGANPAKGEQRSFTVNDLYVLYYVSCFWEEDPDIESIKIGLNRGEHHSETYVDAVNVYVPAFQDWPDDIDGNSTHGALIGGMAALPKFFELANSFRDAGDVLVDHALKMKLVDDFIGPIVYNYRHAIELYLKSFQNNPADKHDLRGPLTAFYEQIKNRFGQELPGWFQDIIKAFQEFDPHSTAFRYGEFIPGETWVDVINLKSKMSILGATFHKIRHL